MRGPTAPKDPEKKRAYFYIMREKEIFGLEQPDGKGVQFLYEDGGRLINSAQIAGSITDEEILELLKTTEGFRKLVHSIGVSVETENPQEKVDFVFQMYGRENPYSGGTNIVRTLHGDGAETRILLEEQEWSEDDKEPGQIRFEFEKPGILGTVNVRLFLNDGYTAPEASEETGVDVTSADYAAMIRRSLMSIGNTARVEAAIKKAKQGEPVTVAYIGGSITQGAGAIPIHTECYAYKSYRAFAEAFGTGDNVRFVKAGVGGTPSELGMLRFDRDVLRNGKVEPDIVIVEFAVNDEGDETKGDCYESLVRKILKLPNHPAVVLLFSVFANDWNLQDRLSVVGDRYNLPMVSIMDAVTPQFRQKAGEGRVLSKNQFFYDIFHPSNIGHTIMADCLTYFFKQAERCMEDVGRPASDDNTEQLLEKSPAIGNTFEDVKLLDRSETGDAEISCGAFEETDKVLQCVEMDADLFGTAEFPYNWMYAGSKAGKQPYFEMRINCKALVLIFKDAGDLSVGRADAFVDGNKILTADPHINGWVHCNPVILFTEDVAKEHVVRIQMAEGDEEKTFTILGFGYVK
ncbi:MAG: GDSL-type esterase/lipase family protein [Roseburia sp.]